MHTEREAMTTEMLIAAALRARNNAYAPYSGYRVGAALLGENGRVYGGCNVENAAYTVCCCAERTALGAAIADGCRSFAAIAVVGGPAAQTPPLGGDAFPCGVCRQALSEFAPELRVIVARSESDYREFALAELLPESFGPYSLQTGGDNHANG